MISTSCTWAPARRHLLVGTCSSAPARRHLAGELADLVAALGLPESDVPTGARAVAKRTGAPVVVTLGGDGVLAATPDGATDHVPPLPATVRDTTGAGDTFNGVLAARLAVGDELATAVRTANAAAALSVGQVGARAGMPTAAELG